MDPQNSPQEPNSWSPKPDHEPEATQQSSSTFPKPADAWPPQEAASGDIEPMTEPTTAPMASAEAALATDERLRAAGPAEQSQTSTQASGAQPKRRAPWRVIIVAALALLLVAGGGAAAYAWYENPDRVLADSLGQLVTAKSLSFNGTGSVTSGSTNVSLTYDGASTQQEVSLHGNLSVGSGSSTIKAEGNVQNDKDGTYYVKIANVKDILASFLASVPAAQRPSIDQMIAKVDNKWIKIPATNTSPAGSVPQVQQCFRTAMSKVQTDGSYRSELTKLYGDHRFVTVKKNLGLSSMSIGYRLTIDPTKERAFVDALPTTKLYGDLKHCDSTLNLDSLKLDTNTSSLPEFELWANILTHQPKRLSIASPTGASTTYSMTVNPVLNPSVSITAPKDSTDIQQLQSELLGLSMAAYGSMAQSSADTATSQAYAVTLQKKLEAYAAENGSYPSYGQIMAAGGISALPADVKAMVVPSAPPASGQISLVPCKDATKGGTISYMDATAGTIKTIAYGSCS